MSKMVVVVEDDMDILDLVQEVLEDAGYDVVPAVGAETVQATKEHNPDVVLLDYQMPGMDGISVAQALHENPDTCRIPIVAMTAAGLAAYVCQEMDASGCLGKPFDIDHLLEVVDRLVHTTH
jgi:two-component system response regulator VicR